MMVALVILHHRLASQRFASQGKEFRVSIGDWLILVALAAMLWRLGDLLAVARRVRESLGAAGPGDAQALGGKIDQVGVAVIDLNRDVANLHREVAALNRSLTQLSAELKRNAAPAAPMDAETAAALRELASLAKDPDKQDEAKP